MEQVEFVWLISPLSGKPFSVRSDNRNWFWIVEEMRAGTYTGKFIGPFATKEEADEAAA